MIPEYAGVTNAVGAVAGNVKARVELKVLPVTLSDETDGFMVYGGEENYSFTDKEEAVQKRLQPEWSRCGDCWQNAAAIRQQSWPMQYRTIWHRLLFRRFILEPI